MKNQIFLAFILLIFSTLFWSGNFLVAKLAYNSSLAPLKLSFFRWFIAFLIILPFSYKSIFKNINLIKDNLKIIVFLSILSVAIFNSFTYIAMQTTLVINASLMGSIAPLFILFFSFIIFKNKTNIFQFLGIILSIIGVSFIVLKGDINNLIYLNFTPGDLWMLIAVMAWALYSVLLKKLDIKLPLITTLSVMIFFGLIFIFPFYVYESLNYGFAPMSILDFIMIFYVAIFAGIFSYLFWNKGVSIIGANRSGVFLHLIPFFSAIWAITFLNEAFAIFHIFGIIFIAIGILLANKKVNL
tara:strand:+ start:640 stop:1536 length:897 start_codon:yes stop_codon:yes gene_type:complete